MTPNTEDAGTLDIDEPSEAEVREALQAARSKTAQKRRAKVKTALAGWVWVSEAQAFVRRSDRLIWSDRQWRSHYAHLEPKGNIALTAQRQPGLMVKFEKLVYEPGLPEEIDGTAYNLWREGGGVEARPGDAQWFLDHIAYLFPEPEVADLVLDFMALLVRRPWTKILFAMLIYGRENGTGKTALGELVKRMIGEQNARTPSNDEVSGKFNAWQEGVQLGIIEELMMAGRQEVANRMKVSITHPTLRLRAMYRGEYTVPNRINFLAFTNHPNALKLDDRDRRWMVIETRAMPRDEAYYDKLFAHIASDADVAAVKHLLETRQVALNPNGRAPVTAAKADMVEQNLPDEEAYILDLFEAGEKPFDFDLVRLDDLVSAAMLKFRGYRGTLMARMTTLLKDHIGAVGHTRNTTPGDGRKKWHLWSVRNHEDWRDRGPAARHDAYVEHQKGRQGDEVREAIGHWPEDEELSDVP